MLEVGVFSASEPQPVEFSRFCLPEVHSSASILPAALGLSTPPGSSHNGVGVNVSHGVGRLWLEVFYRRALVMNGIFSHCLGGQERFKILFKKNLFNCVCSIV